MMDRKGLAPIWIVAIVIVAVGGLFAVYWGYTTYLAAITVVEVDYDGKWGDAFLATKGNFVNSFSQGTDCNVTADILGGAWENCIFESRVALNATAEATMSDHELTLSLALDIDSGPVGPDTEFDIDTGGGTSSTGVPEDDVSLTSVKLYTHEDDPTLVYDMSAGIEDQEDLDSYTPGALEQDEYVLVVKWHTLTVSPAFTDGDDIALLSIDLDTDADEDSAQITVESA